MTDADILNCLVMWSSSGALEEAVETALAERRLLRARVAELDTLVLALSARVADQSEILGKRAERGDSP